MSDRCSLPDRTTRRRSRPPGEFGTKSRGAHRETALTRPVSRVGLGNVASLGNATHCGASSRVVAGVRVSGTLPQRGSLCSPATDSDPFLNESCRRDNPAIRNAIPP